MGGSSYCVEPRKMRPDLASTFRYDSAGPGANNSSGRSIDTVMKEQRTKTEALSL
jgi:hypothetical protein